MVLVDARSRFSKNINIITDSYNFTKVRRQGYLIFLHFASYLTSNTKSNFRLLGGYLVSEYPGKNWKFKTDIEWKL